MKTVLSVVTLDHDGDLALASELCRATGAHLSVLALAVAPSPPMSEFSSAASLAANWLEVRQDLEKSLEAQVDRIEATLQAANVQADVVGGCVEYGALHFEIARRGYYADLILLGPDLLGLEVGPTVLEAALFESGAPVMVVPRGFKPTLSPKRVVLAWDSGYEASRAAREMGRLIEGPSEVHVTMIDPEASYDEQGAEPGADVAAFLARKGYKVAVDRLPSLGQSTSIALERHAGDTAADLLVLGAYGHSRLRQRIFGGVTRSLTLNPPLPLLLAR